LSKQGANSIGSGYALPLAYDGATVTVLKSSVASDGGWTASFICTGCSEWSGGSLDPNAENEFAWAFSTRSPFTPESADSIFPYHTDKDHFSVDLSKAKVSDKEWAALVEELDVPAGGANEKPKGDEKPVDVDDSVEVIVGEPDDEEPVEEPKTTKVEKPVVQTSVIVLTPPGETDVDAPTAVDSDRDGRIPRPTFMPIPEPGEPKEQPKEDPKENSDRIPRPTFLPEPSRGNGDKPAPSTLTTSTVHAIPRPTFLPVPDTPIEQPKEDPDRIPVPRPRPTSTGSDRGGPNRTPVPDPPLLPYPPAGDNNHNPPTVTVTRNVAPTQPRPTITQTVTAIPTPPWGAGPPPWAGRGRGGGRGGGGIGRGRGRGRGG